jgi:hypothetical protein
MQPLGAGDGCRFRPCFEISAEYADVIINM